MIRFLCGFKDDLKIEELGLESLGPASESLCHPGIAPVVLDGDESSLVQDGSNQGVHLGHVREHPEEPHTGPCQKQRHLYNPSVRVLGHKNGQENGDNAKYDGEEDERDE